MHLPGLTVTTVVSWTFLPETFDFLAENKKRTDK
jgi:hypothetical protein